MSPVLNRGPRTSAQSEENQISASTTTHQNVFTVQQIQPQAIFAGAHIDKFEACTFNSNVFCGDQSKIARLNENWSLIDRLRFVAPLVTFHKLLFNHKLFHWAHMKKNGYFVFVHWRSLYKAGLLSRLDWRLVTEVSQLNALARAGKKLMFIFCPFDFLFGHIINILLTELGRSAWKNLDLGRWYRPHCVRSVLATSVKILPYRPPARLIRTNYYMAVSQKDWKQPNRRIWLAKIDIDRGLDFPI